MFFIYINISKPLYKSEATFVLKNINDTNISNSMLNSFLTTNSNNTQDLYILKTFLESPEMLKKIDKKFHLKETYMSSNMDIIFRLFSTDFEKFLELYRSNIKYDIDELNNIVKISFIHPDKNDTEEILNFFMNEGNTFLNDFNKLRAKKEFDFIEEQKNKKLEELKTLEQQIILFQKQHKIIDPELTLEFDLKLLNEFKIRKITLENEINIKKKYVNEKNTELTILYDKLNELDNSIKNIENKLFNNNLENKELVEQFIEFNNLKNLYQFSKEVYISSLSKLESSKIDTIKTSKFIEIISQPYTPEDIYYPKNLFIFFLILSSYFIFIIILKFIINIIKEEKLNK